MTYIERIALLGEDLARTDDLAGWEYHFREEWSEDAYFLEKREYLKKHPLLKKIITQQLENHFKQKVPIKLDVFRIKGSDFIYGTFSCGLDLFSVYYFEKTMRGLIVLRYLGSEQVGYIRFDSYLHEIGK